MGNTEVLHCEWWQHEDTPAFGLCPMTEQRSLKLSTTVRLFSTFDNLLILFLSLAMSYDLTFNTQKTKWRIQWYQMRVAKCRSWDVACCPFQQETLGSDMVEAMDPTGFGDRWDGSVVVDPGHDMPCRVFSEANVAAVVGGYSRSQQRWDIVWDHGLWTKGRWDTIFKDTTHRLEIYRPLNIHGTPGEVSYNRGTPKMVCL